MLSWWTKDAWCNWSSGIDTKHQKPATTPQVTVNSLPDCKVHGPNRGPTWVLSAPEGPHVGPTNLATRAWLSLRLPRLQQGQEMVIPLSYTANSVATDHAARPLRWRHNECDTVSFRRRSKKVSKLRVTNLCAGNSPMNSPHKWPVTLRMLPFDDVIMQAGHGINSNVMDMAHRPEISQVQKG